MIDTQHQLPSPPGSDPNSPLPALPAPQPNSRQDEKEDKKQEEEITPPPKPQRARTRTVVFIVIAIVVLFVALLLLGLIPHLRQRHALVSQASQEQNTPPTVIFIHPARTSEADLSLAANTQAIQDAVLYARTSGYISKRLADLGDRVKKGQLLAEIESPEIDQELRSARALLQQAYKNLDQQKANLEFARVSLDRYKAADTEGAVSKEDLDQRISAYKTAVAAVSGAEDNINSNMANVSRLEQLTGFEQVVAPFDGTVVQRNVDVGTLVTAGSPTNNNGIAPTNLTGGANGLFEVARIDTLRVFVNVPQAYAGNIKVGLGADISVRGQLMSPNHASVTRTADALDPATRTLLAEVDIPNASHRFFPGMFVYVGFKIGPSGTRWRVPATAVIFNGAGTQVVIIEKQNKLHFQKVVLGRDFGATIDIQAGLTGDELIVKQPSVSLEEGQEVQPKEDQNEPVG